MIDLKSVDRPRSHRDVLQSLYDSFDADIRSGKHEPFTYPFNSYSVALVLLFLLFPFHKYPRLTFIRYVVFSCCLLFAIYESINTRSRAIYGTFLVGFLNAWLTIWIFALTVANYPQRDFKRIIYAHNDTPRRDTPQSTANGIADTTLGRSSGISLANGIHKEKINGHAIISKEERVKPTKSTKRFQWEPYPLKFPSRLFWVIDLFLNFRGMAWNWRIKGPPPPPPWVQEQLQEERGQFAKIDNSEYGSSGTKRYERTSVLFRRSLWLFLLGYMSLDALKVLMMRDPYFWGIIDAEPTEIYPHFIRNSPVLVRVIRLTAVMLGIRAALGTILTLSPLFFVGVLGSSIIGADAEPWVYPDVWGNFSTVLDRGLAGWWGSWWHQTFRFGFESPSRLLVESLGLDPKSKLSRAIQLFTAFALSGVIHSSGSYTMTPATYPIRGAFLFFLLQPPVLVMESFILKRLKNASLMKLPPVMKRVLTLTYVAIWFYFTGPLLCDDFTRGGLWLHEPVPVSPLRALGLGVEGDSWWCWEGPLVHWHTNRRWWKSGFHV